MKEEIRELLYKHIDKVDNWNDAIFTSEFDDLVDELDALFDKRIVMDWVAVKDKLPNERGDYLVCQEGIVFEAHFYKENNFWGDYEVCKYENVTHWMHLPEPPCA